VTIRLLLVDDHALIRQGLRRAFESSGDLDVVGEAANIAEAMVMVRATEPQVAVVDINLGDDSGIELCRALRATYPDMGLVILTMYDGDEHLFAALEAGASGFVLKSAPADDVAAAVRQAASAPTAFSATDLAGAMRRRVRSTPMKLTQREDQILQLLSSGKSAAQIASELFISQSTAKTHMSRLYEKLGASNRTQAVMTAVRLGLVKIGE